MEIVTLLLRFIAAISPVYLGAFLGFLSIGAVVYLALNDVDYRICIALAAVPALSGLFKLIRPRTGPKKQPKAAREKP